MAPDSKEDVLMNPEIITYVYAEGTPEERKAFEAKMAQDPNLKAEVMEVKAHLQTIREQSTAHPTPEVPTYITHNILAAATREASVLRKGPSALETKKTWLDYFILSFRPTAAVAFSAMLVFSVALFFNQQRSMDSFSQVAQVDLTQIKMRKASDPVRSEEGFGKSLGGQALLNVQPAALKAQSVPSSFDPMRSAALSSSEEDPVLSRHKEAQLLLMEGKTDASLALFQKILNDHPTYPHMGTVQYEIGRILYNRKQFAQSRPHFEKALKARPDLAPAIERFLRNVDAGTYPLQ